MSYRIANAAGFWGDSPAAPRQLLTRASIDVLTLEYLAELTLSILAYQRQKNPAAGFAHDFPAVLADIGPLAAEQSQLKIVTNAGGMNPAACAQASAKALLAAGLDDAPLAAVSGDDLLPRLEALQREGHALAHFDTGEPLSSLNAKIVSANAYLGARPIAQALDAGARVVVTGRVADASLTLGPLAHRYGWSWDNYDLLAAGSVAGHLIECGAQVTGGYTTDWRGVDFIDIGYPIAEVEADGSCVITKPEGTGGRVTRRTVTEQLIYEIGDPRRYMTPDCVVDFTAVRLADAGVDRVRVTAARGLAAPDQYKVSLAYMAGYTAAAQLLVAGRDCAARARAAAEIVFARVKQAGFELEQTHVECLGAGEGVPQRIGPMQGAPPAEVMLRMTVRDSRREAVERFTKEIAPLITNGPAGLAGYASGRAQVRPVLAYWPALIDKSALEPQLEIRSAKEWNAATLVATP